MFVSYKTVLLIQQKILLHQPLEILSSQQRILKIEIDGKSSEERGIECVFGWKKSLVRKILHKKKNKSYGTRDI